MSKLTQSELERHLWGAADILRGTVDAGDYKQYIFGLLFYKRLCDVWQEEYEALLADTGDKAEAADPDEHRFHIPKEHRWDAVRQHSTQIGQRLNNALAAIEDANLRLRGVFGDVDFANQDRFSDALLEKLLRHFEKHRLRNADVPADMLGDAYLYLIKMFAEGAGKKGGEFYTPRQIVRLMVEIVEPRPGMSIYDPTCGSGGMLLEAVQYLKDRGENARSLSLYGQEKNFATWGIAEINLFLHDVDDAFIAKGDTILSPKRYDPKAREFVEGVGAYDRVLANPPFSEKVWGYEVWQNGDPFGRDQYGCPPKGYGDLAFVQHMLASLKDDGVLAVVVPHGVLFRGGAEGRIREALLRADVVDAVIGLAPNLFYGATIPAVILVLRRNRPKDRAGRILIVNGEETYLPGRAQNALTDNDIKHIADTVHAFKDVEFFSRAVPLEEIAAKNFTLNIIRYVKASPDAERENLDEQLESLQALLDARSETERRMASALARLRPKNQNDDDWPALRFSDLASYVNGRAFKPDDWGDVGLPIIRIAQISNRNAETNFYDGEVEDRHLINDGDLIFSWSATLAVIMWDRGPAVLNQHLFKVTPVDGVDKDWLRYCLEWSIPRLADEAHGTTMKHIKKGTLSSQTTPVPPLNEQIEIAEFFRSIDAAIASSVALVDSGTGSLSGEGHLQHVKRALLDAVMSGEHRLAPIREVEMTPKTVIHEDAG